MASEASVLARLDHPNLPKVSDYFTEDGREYLVMDFVAGRDLRQVLEEERRAGRRFIPFRSNCSAPMAGLPLS